MQIPRKIIFPILFLLPLLLLGGCIGEDNSDCGEMAADGLTIQFIHNINPEYTNTISSVIEYIDLYIYKASGELFSQVRLTKEELEKTKYKYNTYLPDGTYKLVAWMNNGDCYHKEEINNFSNANVRIDSNENHEIFDNTEPLYYGYDDKLYDYIYEEENVIATVEMSWYPVSKTINFAKNTNHIQIDAQFNRVIHEDGDVKVEIKGKNGICNFYNRAPRNNSRADEENELNTYIYYPYLQEEGFKETGYFYTNSSHITTQRLWENDDVEISIVLQEPGRLDKVLVNDKLTDLIMKNPRYNNNFQIERYDYYHIIFQFDLQAGAWVMADIIVNDWHLIKQEENDLNTDYN